MPALDRTVFKTTEVRPDSTRQIQRVIYHYRWFDARGQEHAQKTEFDLTFIWPRELRLLLEREGGAQEDPLAGLLVRLPEGVGLPAHRDLPDQLRAGDRRQHILPDAKHAAVGHGQADFAGH